MSANMPWTNEDLMAYADGELIDERRAALDAALAGDAELRERVARLRAQRERVAGAFAPVLDEPVPERLRQLLAPPAPVVSLDAARAARDAQRSASRPAQWPKRLSPWAQWGGLAASLVLGVLLGLLLPRGDAPQGLAALDDGSLVASGAVAQALTTQLAGDARQGTSVAVQLTFLDKAGHVCRTFTSARVGGLACRDGERWTVEQLVALEPDAAGTMRQAASSLPRVLLDAVDRRIDGNAFDAAQERQARDQGWRR
jgi:anti-sigma factor RsiW